MAHTIDLIPEPAESAAATRARPAAAGTSRARLRTLDRVAVAGLVVLFVAGLGLRATGLGRVGFAEDEINKLEAVRSYARGDITPNAEHPMLMKTLIYVSVEAARVWNWGWIDAPGDKSRTFRISDEAALRFPNALFGALTVLPLFLLTHAFFGRRTALVAAALWAGGVNAVTYNRAAKEDTLLVFFMLSAFYLYVRAKQTSGFEPKRKRNFYVGGGVSFGLMLASKYFPHYLGLNMLYHHFARLREREPGEPRGSTPAIFYAALLAAFLLANPALLLPETWRYIDAYSSERLLTHHGYLFDGALYPNHVSATPFGTPFYFYLLFLAIKVPLPVVAAMLGGLALCVRRRREPGAQFLLMMFVLWIVPYSVMGAKWLRYTLSLMPLVYMLAAVGVVALLGWASKLARGDGSRAAGRNLPARLAVAAVLAVFVAWPAWDAFASRPHHALYTNALADGRAGDFFPHDEFYDDGLREALKFVADEATPGALVVHETPGVARYYLEKFGRADLQSRVLSDPQFRPKDAQRPAYFVLQRGRTYFENREKMDAVRAGLPKVYEGFIEGASAVEVYAAR